MKFISYTKWELYYQFKMSKHPIFSAISREDIRKIQEYADVIDTVEYEGLTPLMFASYNGKINSVDIMIELGAGINYTASWSPYYDSDSELEDASTLYKGIKTYDTPLIIAAKRGHLDIIKLLIKRGARVTAEGVLIGTRNDDIEIVNLFLKELKRKTLRLTRNIDIL